MQFQRQSISLDVYNCDNIVVNLLTCITIFEEHDQFSFYLSSLLRDFILMKNYIKRRKHESKMSCETAARFHLTRIKKNNKSKRYI